MLSDTTEICLVNAPEWFIDNDDLLCEYPSNVAEFLTEDQWENLCELLFLDGAIEEDEDFDFRNWLIGMLGTGFTTVGKFRTWIDEQTENYL